MDVLGSSHLGAALAAMVTGAVVLLSRKGTAWHRRWGWAYVASMATVIATALLIYDLFGYFGPFHVAAMISLGTVAAGLAPAVRRVPRGRWIEAHAYWMSGSYVGLLAAAVSETVTRYMDWPFGASVMAASLLVCAIGIAVMLARVPRASDDLRSRSPMLLTVGGRTRQQTPR